MKNFKKIKKNVSVLKSITCDGKCKKTYTDPFELQEFLEVDFIGGYSSVFGDGVEIKADICQYCLKDMLKNVKIRRKILHKIV